MRSRHGDVLERMLAKLLGNLPSSQRQRARARLIKRWNRDWDVEVADVETSSSPFTLSQPMIDSDGSCQPPRAALAGN